MDSSIRRRSIRPTVLVRRVGRSGHDHAGAGEIGRCGIWNVPRLRRTMDADADVVPNQIRLNGPALR